MVGLSYLHLHFDFGGNHEVIWNMRNAVIGTIYLTDGSAVRSLDFTEEMRLRVEESIQPPRVRFIYPE